MPNRKLLAIESSCDETAAAVIREDRVVLSSVVASQDALHVRFGGVVPEIASRAHVSRILPVIDEALKGAGVEPGELSAVAVATQPGLVGSLLVGLTAAKTLAMVLDVPLIPINHVEAHIYACQMHADCDVFPCIGLVASGGHSNLYDCRSATDFELIGSTLDDAAGEAFDKVAKILKLGYPGGPAIEKAATKGNRKAFRMPRPFLRDERLAFSFSGLKTAVLYRVEGQPGKIDKPTPPTRQDIYDIAACFQEAAVDVLVAKSRQAMERFGRKTLCVGGGVTANARLRERLRDLSSETGFEVFAAPMNLCTDNAAMGAIAWEHFDPNGGAQLDLDVVAGLVRKKVSK